MNENKLAVQAFSKLDLFLEGALDAELNAVIRTRAIVGGLCLVIPLWGLETIIYIIALWGTYVKIANISTVPFKDHLLQNVGGAIIVNIIISIATGLILDTLGALTFGLTFLLSFVIGFASVSISGMAYVKALKALHGSKAKADLNLKSGLASMNNKTGFSRQTSSYINKINEYVEIPTEINTVQSRQTPPSKSESNNGQATYQVILNKCGHNKLHVIKILKEGLGLDLREAKNLADSTPGLVLKTSDKSKADAIHNALTGIGADAVIISPSQIIGPVNQAQQLSSTEQEFIEMYKEYAADGEISERDRRMLNKMRERMGISEERAREIEKTLL